MAHDCPECGQMCYCDGEDTFMDTEEAYLECEHDCSPELDDPLDGDLDEARCRACGCSEFQACEGGCFWAEPDLCSRCAMVTNG